MPRSAADKLRRFYEQFSFDDSVLIIINADPDAIASAMAVKRLLWHKVANVMISNINIINRPDNIAMIKFLGVKLSFIKDVDISRYSSFVIVDSQPDHHEAFEKIKPKVIIDHHPETGITAPFMDIRPKYGANATIMTEYLIAAKIKPSVKLATALFLAIKTDTSNFERQALIEDVRAFQFLFKNADVHLAYQIEHEDIRFDFLKYFKIALEDKCVRKGKLFVHLGHVINPDVCVLIADFFLRVNSINWSIVSGIYEEKLIIIFRNDGIRKNAGEVAKQSFGNVGSAGGHKSMARAEIFINDIKNRLDIEKNNQILKWIITRIEKKNIQDKSFKDLNLNEEEKCLCPILK